jgi:peptidoglycan/LPS O-acetylase OafA/YrhL
MTGVSFADYGFTGLDQMSFIHGPSLWVMDGVMVGYLAVVVGVATLTWRFIEEPGRKLFRHRPASVQLAAAQPA